VKNYFTVFILFMIHAVYGQKDSLAPGPIDSLNHPVSQKIVPFNSIPLKINAIAIGGSLGGSSRYLFDKWVAGSVVTATNTLIQNDSYFFNYDKISNNLLLTRDSKQVIEIDKREFKSFVLKDGRNEYSFKHVYIIDNSDFFQALVQNNKYSLYKSIRTRRVRKNNSAPGDGEYVDSYRYFLVFNEGKDYTELGLKKKSILRNCAFEWEKIDAYFTAHDTDPVDEELLIDLIGYLNK
jgi:hypothetical protein